MQQTETSPPKKGRALTALSVGIIAYVWAGGHFTDKGMLGGGIVRIERENVPEYVAVILFAYYLLRFLTPRWKPWSRSAESIRSYMHRDRAYHRNVNKRARAQFRNKEAEYNGKAGGDRLAIWKNDGQWVTTAVIPDKNRPNKFNEQRVNLAIRDFAWPAIKGTVRTFLFQDTFREDMLPLVLAGSAIVCIIGRVWWGW